MVTSLDTSISPTKTLRFAELHCKSNFSFLKSASHPEELVEQAYHLGYEAIAITDECSVTGIVKAHIKARELGIKLIIGAEFNANLNTPPDTTETICETTIKGEETMHNMPPPLKLIVLAPSRDGYTQLCQLITHSRRQSPKGNYHFKLSDLQQCSNTCTILWIPENLMIDTLYRQGEALLAHTNRFWIGLEQFLLYDDHERLKNALLLSKKFNQPILASNDVRMHLPSRKPLLDTLTSIRLNKPISSLGFKLLPNSERHLRPLEKLEQLYPKRFLRETTVIAKSCTFSLDELHYSYPKEVIPPGTTSRKYLRLLTYSGAAKRWPEGIPDDVIALIEKELTLIKELSYEHYFLTVHDIVQFARERNILCQGRGSAANSAVCYCLHITEVDPSRMRLLFERFISKERNEPPDIDVDFEHERREEVIQYIYKKYGRNRAALAATLITYRPRSAIRDVGRALGFDHDLIDLLAKSISWWDNKNELHQRLTNIGIDPNSKMTQLYLTLINQILGFPRHLSQHVGGFIISDAPLYHLVPIENAAMENRTVIQWDKDDLESLGLLKIDILALGMLTAIRKSLALINNFRALSTTNRKITIQNIPAEDPATYKMLQRADSIGVFQVESRAQMSMLPRLRPNYFYDLVIEVAIVRPGPIQGNMVHPYLRRRQGLEPVTYPSQEVQEVLQRTLGVPIFQEQVIELAMVAAGFSAGEADQLSRAMAAWRRRGGLEKFERKLIDGMLQRGHDRAFAERVFQQIQGFGEYGFPESHAASFALLVYVSAWLKCHEPAAFYSGLLNSLPMGFYSPSQLIQDALRHDIVVLPVDVQHSKWNYSLEPIVEKVTSSNKIQNTQLDQGAIRIGLRQIKGLQESSAIRIENTQPFHDINDLHRRACLNDQELSFLARSGALATLSGHRYQAHWDTAGIDRPSLLWKSANIATNYDNSVQLEGPSIDNNMLADYTYLGVTLGPHPIKLIRNQYTLKNCKSSSSLSECRNDQFIEVAGIVTCRQRPGTKTGVLFLTLEDETGNSNIIVWQSILKRFRSEVLQGSMLLVKGTVQKEGEVIHVIAGHIKDLSHLLPQSSDQSAPPELLIESRNFH